MNYSIKENILIKDYLNKFYLGKSTIYKLFLNKKILVNNLIVKDNYLLKEHDILTIISEKLDIKPYDYEIEIVYEDDYLLIINKPYGFLIHDESNKACDNIVANYYLKKGLDIKVRHIHRLDRETTGLLIYAKDILTESYFNYHLAKHDFKRYYLAVVENKLKKELVIEKPIGKDRHHNNRYLVLKNGKYAKTYVYPIKFFKNYTLVKVLLETGRTHQIRVHLKSVGHPLASDPIYNPGSFKMALESYEFIFIHPFKKREIKVKCQINEEVKFYEK